MAKKMEAELRHAGRWSWFEQSCLRALEQSLVDRPRDAEDAWRISGSGKCAAKRRRYCETLEMARKRSGGGRPSAVPHLAKFRTRSRSAKRFTAENLRLSSFLGSATAEFPGRGQTRSGNGRARMAGSEAPDGDAPYTRDDPPDGGTSAATG